MKNNTLATTREDHLRRRLATGLRAAMRRQQLNQKQVAARADINKSHLSEIINEKVSPKLETIAKLEAGLGMNLIETLSEPTPFEL